MPPLSGSTEGGWTIPEVDSILAVERVLAGWSRGNALKYLMVRRVIVDRMLAREVALGSPVPYRTLARWVAEVREMFPGALKLLDGVGGSEQSG